MAYHDNDEIPACYEFFVPGIEDEVGLKFIYMMGAQEREVISFIRDITRCISFNTMEKYYEELKPYPCMKKLNLYRVGIKGVELVVKA